MKAFFASALLATTAALGCASAQTAPPALNCDAKPADCSPKPSPASPQFPPQLDRIQRADGAHVVPDHFLRRWDPLTILFDNSVGPQNGGPEDAPEKRGVTLSPPKPGSWTWLGPKTLQFRPTEPWEPLRRVTVTVAGASTTLVPLLPVPTATGPAESSNGAPGLDTLSLTFDQPVDLAALARLLTIDITPQAGVSETGTQTLTAQDFDLRPVERASRGDKQVIMVVLRRPIPDGRVATLRLRLSDEPNLDDPNFTLSLRSATPFKLTDTACGDSFYHATVDGVDRCDPSPYMSARPRQVALQFSEQPEKLDIVKARDVLRITPPLDDLTVSSSSDGMLRIGGKFAADQVYQIAIAPGALHDTRGRVLAEAVNARVSFSAGTPALGWDVPQGIVERLGPQMAPLRGHGYDHADVRIYPIDPLSRDFWPFPRNGLVTNDDHPPPLPGNEPASYGQQATLISGDDMARRILALGSPSVSELMPLPIHAGGVDAKFGLDLAPSLAKIAGAKQPGTYLVGLRTVDSPMRQWARLQVTDLSLTTVESPDRVRFVVTSLSSAAPVAGAQIELDGTRDNRFGVLAKGVTAADGSWVMTPPLARGLDGGYARIERIVVTKATDTLVLEPGRGPQQYANGNWTRPTESWLDWTGYSLTSRQEKPKLLCHVYTERPIYRPEEPVLIAGMIRRGFQGGLSYASGKGEVLIKAPGDQEWRLPVTLDDVGGFHVKFDEKTQATGDYSIQYLPENSDNGCGAITIKKEAYRLPTFEVVLAGPQTAPLDAPFQVNLLARFYAGGLLSDRPITWRVTQFPHVWTPPGREGFLFSSDSRFSGGSEFRSTPVMNQDAKTDAGGSAQLTLDPTIEPTAQPREYVVEATVTGDDDMQVRSTQHVVALPPFVLGVKVPRYLPQVGAIDPEIVALDGEGHEVQGLPLTVRLIHRQWNSVLQASDFAQGSAKYQTQVIDETVEERKLTSGAAPQTLHFGAAQAGVYLVEVTAADKVGRTQTVKVDLFMSGDTPVTWRRPPSQTITVSADKSKYDPGETATLLIQSPFQTARALAIVEEPEGQFRYDWVDIANGQGRYQLPIRARQTPQLPVHFLLMRGRLPGPVAPNAPFDQGKPVSLAATTWVKVNPTDNIVKVSFDAPAQARPEQEFDLVLHLSDPAGHPLAGEATVWMVDQAVLALAKEQPLDPLPAFIVNRPSRMALRDTRNMAFGVLPLIENPGGDEAGDSGMENISVRKNFTPVPLYQARVKVGPDGTARIHVKLPDTLTVYMLRAKAISGPSRFGYGTGQIKIRQPVVAQPALPRFVRPGDTFTARVIGRIVEGPGGAGRAAIATQNLTVIGEKEQNIAWEGQRPTRGDFTVTVPQPPAGTTSARVTMTVQRSADHVGDAVQLDLPIKPDRPVVHRRDLLLLKPDGTLDIPALTEAVRPQSYRDTLTLSSDPAVAKLIAGANFLTRPIIGGAEQRLALARGELALMPFAPLLDATGLRGRVDSDISTAIASVKQSIDDDGLVAFFPHTRGSVWLTASAYRMMVQAKRAGLDVDEPLMDRMSKVLTAALRSDYPHLMTSYELFDRVAALIALADGGQITPDYAAELARQAQFMRTGTVAQVATVLANLPQGDPQLRNLVLETLWNRVNFLARDGKPVYAGLVDQPATALILPSEARSLAEVTQAVASALPQDPRLPLLRGALLGMADGQGWGSTNATAAALEALTATWQAPQTAAPVAVTLPSEPQGEAPDAARAQAQTQTAQAQTQLSQAQAQSTQAQAQPSQAQAQQAPQAPPKADGAQPRPAQGTNTEFQLNETHPLLQVTSTQPGPIRVQGPAGLAALNAVDYVPLQPGAQAQADQHGFVLTRTLMRVPPVQSSAQGPVQPPMERLEPDSDGVIHLTVGDVVEEIDELVNPEQRDQVALRLPLAAGMEPLNPNLATATAQAQPSAAPTLAPSWSSYGDDEVTAVYLSLPAGAYTLRTRMRATIAGSFTAPPASAEMLYHLGISGSSAGNRIVVAPGPALAPGLAPSPGPSPSPAQGPVPGSAQAPASTPAPAPAPAPTPAPAPASASAP